MFISKKKQLLKAAEKGDNDKVTKLLETVSIETKNKLDETALHKASMSGKQATVKLLLSRGANLQATTSQGKTPLDLAIDINVCRVLKSEATHKYLSEFQQAAEKGASKMVEKFLKLGVNIDAKNIDDKDMVAIHYASKSGKTATVKVLLDRGATIDARDRFGLTSLHYASHFGRTATIELLLNRGSNIEAASNSGKKTALHQASASGYFDAVKLLLNRGAFIGAKTSEGKTPMELAKKATIRSYLQTKFSEKYMVELREAATNGDNNKIKKMLNQGISIDAKDKDGEQTALHFACYHGQTGTIKFLLDRHANIEAKSIKGYTPLHLATFSGKSEAVQLLLERGAKIEAKTKVGFTALFYACCHGKKNNVELLLSRGANCKAQDNKGKEPLDYTKDESIRSLLESSEMDVAARLEKVEVAFYSSSKKGAAFDRIKQLEQDVVGEFGSGTAFTRVVKLEQALGMNTKKAVTGTQPKSNAPKKKKTTQKNNENSQCLLDGEWTVEWSFPYHQATIVVRGGSFSLFGLTYSLNCDLKSSTCSFVWPTPCRTIQSTTLPTLRNGNIPVGSSLHWTTNNADGCNITWTRRTIGPNAPGLNPVPIRPMGQRPSAGRRRRPKRRDSESSTESETTELDDDESLSEEYDNMIGGQEFTYSGENDVGGGGEQDFYSSESQQYDYGYTDNTDVCDYYGGNDDGGFDEGDFGGDY